MDVVALGHGCWGCLGAATQGIIREILDVAEYFGSEFPSWDVDECGRPVYGEWGTTSIRSMFLKMPFCPSFLIRGGSVLSTVLHYSLYEHTNYGGASIRFYGTEPKMNVNYIVPNFA